MSDSPFSLILPFDSDTDGDDSEEDDEENAVKKKPNDEEWCRKVGDLLQSTFSSQMHTATTNY